MVQISIKMLLTLALFLPISASAVLLQLNDLTLPGSTDGFNITRDTSTGFEWLDVAATKGRSYDDLTGVDGTNEFAMGGDFEGFRYATRTEIDGNTALAQVDSLLKSAGLGVMAFSDIGSYPTVKSFLDLIGCSGDCATYGYAWGNSVNDDLLHEEVKVEAFDSGSNNFGSASYGDAGNPVLEPRPGNTNGFAIEKGNWLVRTSAITPVPVPAAFWLFGSGLIGLVGLVQSVSAAPNP